MKIFLIKLWIATFFLKKFENASIMSHGMARKHLNYLKKNDFIIKPLWEGQPDKCQTAKKFINNVEVTIFTR